MPLPSALQSALLQLSNLPEHHLQHGRSSSLAFSKNKGYQDRHLRLTRVKGNVFKRVHKGNIAAAKKHLKRIINSLVEMYPAQKSFMSIKVRMSFQILWNLILR